MTVRDLDRIDSEFRVLDEEYDTPGFYGGALEASHALGNLIVLRLYSIVPESETDSLRIETRQHYAGRVISHRRTEYELADDRTVDGTPLETFCRSHHFESPRQEIRSLVEEIQASEEYTL